ncbi:MAG: acyltransferase [Microbacterium sp.]|uniref:acyltransferase family protein n=1 Tax=Microbacterium sp. TaxID=51671 RepID=UPI001D76D3EE|nr:acyltransferase [Microbacterium sp.]MBW8761696.1 acyltransferase [Microbacterium sp.]
MAASSREASPEDAAPRRSGFWRELNRSQPFPYRENSLNMFRLCLAALVLFAHTWYITGRGVGPQIQGENLGTWAVAGFFVLSGFLITRSRMRTPAAGYLLHRVARIYPAFFACLVVTAVAFGPIAAVLEHGSLSGYLRTPTTPLEYVWGNLGLAISQYDIGITLNDVPYPNVWNGSLWTLYYEFLCYLVVGVLGSWALFRRTPVVVGILFVLSVIIWARLDVMQELGLDVIFSSFARLLPFFLGGALVYFVVERWGFHRWASFVALSVALAMIVFLPHWGGQASSPFLAYGLLGLSTVIPQPAWIARNDVSYGFYIYAWPIQQLVFLAGGATWGIPVYLLLTLAGTAVLAAMSWFLIERPIMRRVRRPVMIR